jgi:hypothetical protein
MQAVQPNGNNPFATGSLGQQDGGLTGSNLAAVGHLCFTRVVAQFTAFDGVINAASMSSCAARRSSLML